MLTNHMLDGGRYFVWIRIALLALADRRSAGLRENIGIPFPQPSSSIASIRQQATVSV